MWVKLPGRGLQSMHKGVDRAGGASRCRGATSSGQGQRWKRDRARSALMSCSLLGHSWHISSNVPDAPHCRSPLCVHPTVVLYCYGRARMPLAELAPLARSMGSRSAPPACQAWVHARYASDRVHNCPVRGCIRCPRVLNVQVHPRCLGALRAPIQPGLGTVIEVGVRL